MFEIVTEYFFAIVAATTAVVIGLAAWIESRRFDRRWGKPGEPRRQRPDV